jgi:hypothetical protein
MQVKGKAGNTGGFDELIDPNYDCPARTLEDLAKRKAGQRIIPAHFRHSKMKLAGKDTRHAED